MLTFLPAHLRGVIAITLYALNIIIGSIILYFVSLIKIIPSKPLKRACDNFLHQLPFYWQDVNNFIQWLTAKTQWDIRGLESLERKEWYLMVCNHQSWADILVLEKVFQRKIPMLKFFMKKQLLWTLPFAAWSAWLLNFPFMERYSKEKLLKHPELKGKDLATTKRSCEKFKLIPSTVITFPEGTRFTFEKQQKQTSPYRYLLRPRAGGLAFTLSAMNGCLHKLINVTIVYPEAESSAWSFFCGVQKKIVVHIEVLPITSELIGDYENDREFRVKFQNWFNQLWQDKDDLIAHLKGTQTVTETQGVSHAK